MREQHGFRHRAALRVILLDERAEHLAGVAFGQVEQGVFLALERAAAVVQHAHARSRLSLHEADGVKLRERTRDDVLPVAQLFDGAEPVAQHRRPLELQSFRRLVHFFRQIAYKLLCVAL